MSLEELKEKTKKLHLLTSIYEATKQRADKEKGVSEGVRRKILALRKDAVSLLEEINLLIEGIKEKSLSAYSTTKTK